MLPRAVFQQGLATYSTAPLAPLFDTKYLSATLTVTGILVAAFLLAIVWSRTTWAKKLDVALDRLNNWGLLVVRLAIAASFLYGASGNVVFGPEVSLVTIPLGQIILWLKVIVGIAFVLGIFTEAAAVVGLVIYIIVAVSVGQYLLTYLNYLGELLALALFGSRFLSVDRIIFGAKSRLVKWRDNWEVPIIRIGLGLALIYTAWNIKFEHQLLPIDVINQYRLGQFFFNWSATYIAAGAGMVEMMIGVFVLIGFRRRLTVMIFMAFITLSLLYFREAVWPHLMLYGISLLILVAPADRLTVDRYLDKWLGRKSG